MHCLQVQIILGIPRGSNLGWGYFSTRQYDCTAASGHDVLFNSSAREKFQSLDQPECWECQTVRQLPNSGHHCPPTWSGWATAPLAVSYVSISPERKLFFPSFVGPIGLLCAYFT